MCLVLNVFFCNILIVLFSVLLKCLKDRKKTRFTTVFLIQPIVQIFRASPSCIKPFLDCLFDYTFRFSTAINLQISFSRSLLPHLLPVPGIRCT
jgi:hypothetical protein